MRCERQILNYSTGGDKNMTELEKIYLSDGDEDENSDGDEDENSDGDEDDEDDEWDE